MLSWKALDTVYEPGAEAHAGAAARWGLSCPVNVFSQLFHGSHGDQELEALVRFVDWSKVRWQEASLSGVALRFVGVPRYAQHGVDEARLATLEYGFQDERPEVMVHWEAEHTWIQPPIVLAGELLQSSVRHELIVGFTRLGNLLGELDRQGLSESSQHRVWLGKTR